MASSSGVGEPKLNKVNQVKYWKRCLKTYLPAQYTSNESNRMYLAYFIISALELLNVLDDSMTHEERVGYIEWIYHCQHPQGGFRMWPGTDFGDRANSDNARWDPGHVPATYFALTTLVSLGDDLRRVKHENTLQWLRTMQRPDGSFGETMVNGCIEGGRDPRYGYCAAAIRYIVKGLYFRDDAASIQDIDTMSLARCVVSGQSYDGGIADAQYHEPQAGYTFCTLGALNLLGTLHDGSLSDCFDREAVTKWLVDRQTDLMDPDIDQEDSPSTTGAQTGATSSRDAPLPLRPGFAQSLSPLASDILATVEVRAAGMNGRPNKIADTCYAWWVEASLHMLGFDELYHRPAVRSYLLNLTQHPYMGGFTKFPDDRYADVYHSFMGLAALSLASSEAEREQDGIASWDATMCMSMRVVKRLKMLQNKSR